MSWNAVKLTNEQQQTKLFMSKIKYTNTLKLNTLSHKKK